MGIAEGACGQLRPRHATGRQFGDHPGCRANDSPAHCDVLPRESTHEANAPLIGQQASEAGRGGRLAVARLGDSSSWIQALRRIANVLSRTDGRPGRLDPPALGRPVDDRSVQPLEGLTKRGREACARHREVDVGKIELDRSGLARRAADEAGKPRVVIGAEARKAYPRGRPAALEVAPQPFTERPGATGAEQALKPPRPIVRGGLGRFVA